MIRNDRPVQLPLVRILHGIRNFGYTFESAIFDIIDNSIVAEATEIKIILEYDENVATKKLVRIIIIDNGSGMNSDEIYNALFLGSPKSVYSDNSLSKYGFGLKSAGLSLADTVTIVSRNSADVEWSKSQINWDTFIQQRKYVVEEELEIGDDAKYLPEKTGTVVILSDLLEINKVNATKASKLLKKEAAVIFHRFIEEGIAIYVNDDKIAAFDPLFCSELEGKFSEYDGRAPRSFWEKDTVIPINSKTKAKALVKAVLLPCPPLFEKEGKRPEILKKYGITKANIGFYIYRNRRLIKKGVTLGLINRQDKTYHIRIRIDLDSTCDEFINLDVKKTELYFDEAFMERLGNRVNPFINRAIALWDEVQNKGRDENQTVSDIKHDRSNKLLSEVSPVECDPQSLEVHPAEQRIKQKKEQLEAAYSPEPSILDQIKEKNKDRIIAVDNLENGLLWRPSLSTDGKSKVIVLLSRSHPFYTSIYQKLAPGSDAVVILDALFLSLAMSEMGISSADTVRLPKIFKRLCQSVSIQLSNIIDLSVDIDEENDDGEG